MTSAIREYTVATKRRKRKYWTLADYRRAIDDGIFKPEERLELIRGEIVKKMTQNEPHTWAVSRAGRALQKAFEVEDRYFVRYQMPIVLPHDSMPEPDLVVMRGSLDDNLPHPDPETAALVVEVSDTSLSYDVTGKAALYAEDGISDYWVVVIQTRQVIVHRDPRSAAEGLHARYQDVRAYAEGEDISPLVEPVIRICAADLLPRR